MEFSKVSVMWKTYLDYGSGNVVPLKGMLCCMPQVDAESLLDQLHKYQSVQGNSEDIAKLQIQITQLQVCI
jgi:hypothetical protein